MRKQPHGKYSETFSYGRIWLGKRRDSGIWYIRCPVPNRANPIFQSLGTTLKKDAIKEAELLYQQVVSLKYGIADDTIPLTLLIEKYFKAKEGRIKLNSTDRVKTSQVRFIEWLKETHPEVVLVKHLSYEIAREYQQHRTDSELSPRTVNNDITNMHSIFKWGMKEHCVNTSPFDYSDKTGNIDLYKLPENEADVYSQPEYHGLLAEAKRLIQSFTSEIRKQTMSLIHDIIIVFAGTGMRFEELAHLRRKNIHWDVPLPIIEVRGQNGWTPKDPREIKRIPMLPEVQEVIRRRCNDCQNNESFVFTNIYGDKIHEGKTLARLKKLFPAVGISSERRLFWHSFRNYFIIRCLSNKPNPVAIPAIMKWTGHDSATMILHYAQVINETDTFAEFNKLC